MARTIGVEVIGDGASAEKMFAKVGASATAFAEVSTKASASVTEARIAASAKTIASLRRDSEAFAAASASYVKGSDEQIAASKLLIDTQHRLQIAMGETAVATSRTGHSAGNTEKDVSRFTRGALAGSGAVRGLGRSLAFASASFLGVAAAADVIRGSIVGAETLAKAQEGLAVAIEHTGGNLTELLPKYEEVAKGAARFGVNQADATVALERATVLTGSAARAQRAYQEALVISKATGKDFNAVLTATSKGQEGITTSLQRYGIQIAKGTKGTEQFAVVMSRFGGQARANTSAADRLRAVFANTEATIGTALLPAFDKYLTKLADWLEKMQKSGKLQRDVNTALHDGSSVFHVVGDAISAVDKVTGSFLHTLELLAAFKLASLATGWIGSLSRLATEWGIVTKAAEGATAAETVAGGGAGVAAGRAGGGFLAGAGASKVVQNVSKFTGAGAAEAGGAAVGLTGAAAIAAGVFGGNSDQLSTTSKTVNGWKFFSIDGGKHWIRGPYVGFTTSITPDLRSGQLPSFLPQLRGGPRIFGGARTGGDPTQQGPFGTTQKQAPFKTFSLTLPEQITQARADLTKSTADDVAAAKQVIARVKRLMSEGKLAGKSLLSALQAEGAAMNTLQSAQAAAAQKATAAAQAQIQNMIDPIRLETQLSKAEALGQPTVAILKALKASAEKALASGKLSLQQQKAAWDQIASINQAIAQAASTATKTFTAPAKLQLALAKDSALGLDQTKDLLKLKAAILKFIQTHKKNTQALIDAYNQLAQVNQQLGSSASALGNFKQANTRKLVKGLGLTTAQQKALRARLSQLGPGGTVPGGGVGAFGVVINPKTGRAAKVPHGAGRISGSGGGGGSSVANTPIDLNVYIDGRHVEATVTRRQQKRARHNSSQRRGPNAGDNG